MSGLGDHLAYVVGAYGVTALLMLVEPLLGTLRHRRALRRAREAE
ncbi:heme exporter protein CcmD [Caldimonas sp. KR1-144]